MSTFTDEDIQLLVDERAISRLLITFSRCIDTKDFDGYASLFAVDGELVTPWGGGHKGRDGLAAYVGKDLGGYAALHHVSAGHDIHIDGDHATVRATLLATHVNDDTATNFWSVGGHYDLQLIRDGRGWLLTRVEIKPAWRFDTSGSEN
ncbi:nuclear transport factor 2 family protein [Microbacterium sp. 22215]|uniref:nuclear transport factor 2 family protein n=1 Tax=Microbacterium sp. 22215 TaxID=3453893 RepID=UPI003F87CC84